MLAALDGTQQRFQKSSHTFKLSELPKISKTRESFHELNLVQQAGTDELVDRWNVANTNCIEFGGHLVSIHSEMENKMVQEAVRQFETSVFIGLYELDSGLNPFILLAFPDYFISAPKSVFLQAPEVYRNYLGLWLGRSWFSGRFQNQRSAVQILTSEKCLIFQSIAWQNRKKERKGPKFFLLSLPLFCLPT